MIKDTAKQLLPPFIYSAIQKSIYKKRSKNKYFPKWYIIKSGNLKGRNFFIDPRDGYWQKEIIDGNFENFFFDYLKKINLEGKIVFEIGAHIGYHAMNFAQLVGKSGCVYAFEPNIFNRERMQEILTKNPDLANRIKLYEFAISDRIGEVEFNFSPTIENGLSSNSFISGSNTPYDINKYQTLGFDRVMVKTMTLDKFSSTLGIEIIPYLIKIDVEGAENLVLQGSMNILKKYKPILLIEIHSVVNMLKAYELFNFLGYNIELLEEESSGRCFIAATAIM
jgi:FkbM family methyltransferase